MVPARENPGAPDPAPVWQHEPAGEAGHFEFEVELPHGPVLLRVIAYDAAGRPSTPAECFVPNLEAAAHAVVTRFGHLFVTNGSPMRRDPNGAWCLLDEDRLAVCDTPHDRVLILDRTDGRLITTLDGLTAPRAAIATPEGQLLVACANGVAVRAGATLAPGRLMTEASGGPIGHATGLALNVDGSLLVVEPWLPLRTVTPEHLLAQR